MVPPTFKEQTLLMACLLIRQLLLNQPS
jgi:hypothetical protein